MGADVLNKEYEVAPAGGTGLCPEAQADGVPCTELGRDCEICERAYPNKKDEE
jgi:hypothetical protein